VRQFQCFAVDNASRQCVNGLPVVCADSADRWVVRPDQQLPYGSSSKDASAADVHTGSANEIFSQVEEAIARHTSVRMSERFDPLSVHMALTWKNLNYFVKGE